MENTSPEFRSAVENLGKVKDVDNQVKLRVYALYKQVTLGENTTKKPGLLDMVGKMKWEAWKALGDMNQRDAEMEYIQIVGGMLKDHSPVTGTGENGSELKEVLVTTTNGIRTITLNRPEKKNAFTREMFEIVTKTLQDCNTDEAVNIVVITGSGDYFTSGNDLGNFTKNMAQPRQELAKAWKKVLLEHFAAYIDLKKILVAIVNGPAVGLGVTLLGHCDAVFASDKATFTTPFTSLGQTPEACSSHIFPRIMGTAIANEILLFNQTFSALQAQNCGLVTQVYSGESLGQESWKRINDMAQLPEKSLLYSKELVRGGDRQRLHAVNKEECARLEERFLSDDCTNAVLKYFSQKTQIINTRL